MVLLLIFLNYICHLLIFYCYIIYFIVTSIIYYNFISNIDKGIKASEKRLILFEYLRNNINNRGFIFLQEIYSSSKDEQKCKDDFKGPLFFSHGKAVFVVWQSAILEQKLFLKWQAQHVTKNRQILILDVELNDTDFLLMNFYNSNSESEQPRTFSTLQKLLERTTWRL